MKLMLGCLAKWEDGSVARRDLQKRTHSLAFGERLACIWMVRVVVAARKKKVSDSEGGQQ
jgi:hypothetical protein